MATPKPMARDLLEEEEEDEEGSDETAPPEETLCTVNVEVCFWDKDAEDALMSTSTDWALSVSGVPEIVREVES